MKPSLLICALIFVLPAFAQQTAPQQKSTTTVQMVCRDMSKTGNSLKPGEIMINGLACHPENTTASDSKPTAAAVASGQNAGAPAQPAADPADTAPHKPRVYVTSSDSWVTSGGFAGGASGDANSFSSASAGHFSGGSDPQTVEIIKNFMDKCPGVIVTQNRSNADYAVLFDREGGKRGTSGWNGLLRKVDKMAVFRKNGDAVFSESTRSVGTTVKNACSAIEKTQNNN